MEWFNLFREVAREAKKRLFRDTFRLSQKILFRETVIKRT
jgi:hypothetical protein